MMLELEEKHEVWAYNFKRQYPSLLFPGTTQFVTPEDDATMVCSERLLDSINPFSWTKTAKAIASRRPYVVYVSWWMSFFGPSLGLIARYLRKRGIKVVGILHNVIPHEPHFWDKPLTRYFLDACDGVVTLSREGTRTLAGLGEYRHTELFHPVYNQFGEAVPRQAAEKTLGLRSGCKNLLFFGLIRKYKGLDLLIKAFGHLPEDYQLIIAGEPYGSFDEYSDLIDESPAGDRIRCFLGYVPDVDVKVFFSAADLTVLPYRSATQSGVMAVSYHFGVPLLTTDTGSLKEDVQGRNTGIVLTEPSPEDLANAIKAYFSSPSDAIRFREGISKELERLSWKSFCRSLTEFTESL